MCKLRRAALAALLLVLHSTASSHARMLHMVAPAPAPGLSSASGLASDDCYNYRAVVTNADTAFVGPLKRLTVGPVAFAYRRFGPLSTESAQQGPLVLIIGIGLTMHDWTPRLLQALAAEREVLVFDNPGIGLSSIAAGSAPAPEDYFRFQARSVAALITALNLRQPDLLGWSLGAKIALHVAVYHGDVVRRIISDAGTAGGNASTTAVLALVSGQQGVADGVRLGSALLQRPADVHAACQWLLETSVMPADPVSAEQVRAQLAAEQAYHEGAGLVPLLPTIANPLLLVTATDDMINPASNEVVLKQQVPGAVLVNFVGCGHLALFQEVGLFARLVAAFTAADGAFVPQPESYYRCNAGNTNR